VEEYETESVLDSSCSALFHASAELFLSAWLHA